MLLHDRIKTSYLPSLDKAIHFTPQPLATCLQSTWDMAGVIDKWCMCKTCIRFWRLTKEKNVKYIINILLILCPNIHWKDWCWSSNTLATWCEELNHWKRPWCWESLKAGGEGTHTETLSLMNLFLFTRAFSLFVHVLAAMNR